MSSHNSILQFLYYFFLSKYIDFIFDVWVYCEKNENLWFTRYIRVAPFSETELARVFPLAIFQGARFSPLSLSLVPFSPPSDSLFPIFPPRKVPANGFLSR